ncbi:hypothetical protein Mapa_003028 [Marchantia paleacea]|nr:hypothetical protein Mapa_003028 [Marchantia paleacea]
MLSAWKFVDQSFHASVCNAVKPSSDSASISTCGLSSSSRRTSWWPLAAARCNTVNPPSVLRFTSATSTFPFSNLRVSSSPVHAARCRSVTPRSFIKTRLGSILSSKSRYPSTSNNFLPLIPASTNLLQKSSSHLKVEDLDFGGVKTFSGLSASSSR